jgi:nicotinate dehydrogenase subunit B
MQAQGKPDIAADSHKLPRREFLGSLAGGLIVLLRTTRLAGADADDDQRLEVWLHIGADGIATGFTGKVEFGQATRTGFTQLIAEELDLPMDRVRVIMGDTDRVPFDNGTYASLSTEMMRPRFQRAGARARVLLQRRAAQRWDVPEAQTQVRGGRVLGPAGQSVDLGELVKDAPLVDVLEYEPEPKAAETYRLVGKDVARVDGIQRVTGSAVYGTDITSPGMLHGAVLRPPSWEARLVRLDLTQAEAVAGVVKVVRDADFVGVVAESESTARTAVRRLQAQWEDAAGISDAGIRAQLEAACADAKIVHEDGDEGRAWDESRLKHEAVYETSFVYHAALEPQAAWANVDRGEVWIRASTQRPFGVRKQIADLLKLPPDKVHVTVSEIGGGFGRKNDADAPYEAVLLSQAVGCPVRVVWTRNDDFTQSSFRPAARMQVKAGVSGDGQLVAWDYCLAAAGGHFSSSRDVQSYYQSDFHRTRFTLVPSGVRVGSFRGLGSPINAFARESFMDELAYAAGLDPLTFRLQALGKRMPRLSAVLRAVAANADWEPSTIPSKSGHGFGLACCLYRDKTYVAQLAEVHVDEGDQSMRVEKVVTAVDCGFVVNPDGVRKQAEGGVTMATSYSLGEAVQIEGATMSNASFGRYPILRIDEAPQVETIFVGESQNASVGVGEPVTVPVAAALANAYFDATGVRKRRLPLL